MDAYSSLTSWALFGGACVGLAYYYWPNDQRKPDKTRTNTQAPTAGSRRRNEQERRAKPGKGSTLTEEPDTQKTAVQTGNDSGKDVSRKRKTPSKQAKPAQAPVTTVQPQADKEEVDMSAKQFAQNFMQARKGADFTAVKGKENRTRTVKQGNAKDDRILSSGSSQAGAEADDDMSPVISPALNAGNVDDMLEPVAPGPSTLRLTASNQPQKQKTPRQPKEEVVETKKQRQNRKKVEERREQREAEERERKALEERQRRAAREARGEPAKNGLGVSKPPATSAWTPTTSASANTASDNSARAAPLLDTFDVESSGSSNGGMTASTAATSTTGAGASQNEHEHMSEEEQMAMAMKQSEDESGWTTVAQPKKPKKKGAEDGTSAPDTEPTTVSTPKPTPAVKTASNGKPKGYQALEVQYQQRADADPDDASNWDA